MTGSLRVTDTIYTTDLLVSGSKTAKYVLAAPNGAAGAPTWRALVNSDVGLGNVENTKLSTWAGTSNITTVGTISSGTWQGTSVKVGYGGTGTTTAPTQGGIIFGSSTTAYGCTAAGTSGQLLQSAGTSTPTWITATNSNTASTIVKRDASGNFSAGTITASLSGNATSATTTVSLQTTTSTISGGSTGTHAQGLQTYFSNYKDSTPRNKLLAFYDSTSSNGSITFGYFLEGHDSSPYGGFFSAHYNTPYYVGINNGTFTQSQLWKAGDSVTGAVWNDYAEYRRANTTEPGRCVEENDNGTLTLTKYRLIPGASIISDTWGFSQGESEEAKTPVAVSGRVLAYPYRNRDKYHAGQAVCSGPNGTVDIMTRREIQEYPDAIIGIVSEIPDYEEWGGGDRDPVKVNGRIWIKVR